MPRLVLALAALALSSLALAGDLTIPGEGGVSLSATDWGEGEQCVVLIHGDGGTRAEWGPFAQKLAHAGFKVVALDLRGHGDTGGTVAEADYPSLVSDVSAGAAWLHAQGCAEVHAVGAGLGANLVLNAAAVEGSPITDLVVLSPRPNIKGVKVLKAAEAYEGAILVLTEADHILGVKTANAIEDRVSGHKEIREVVTDASGLTMLNRDVALEGLILSWIGGTFHLADPSGEARRELATSTGDLSDIETTGTKYGEDK